MSISTTSKEVYFVSSEEHIKLCDLHPKVSGRASLVDSLLEAYNLKDKLKIVQPKRCSKSDLMAFHTSEFVECISSIQKHFDEITFEDDNDKEICKNFDISEVMEEIDYDILSHGFGYDCEIFPKILEYSQSVAGATLTAAELLIQSEKGKADIAINLHGGWHHAHVDEVAGFCYVNDIVIGILHLMKKFKRILYIDFDVHHGDGVEEAFKFSKKVVTLSLHKYANGFFPGTGDIDECGDGSGEYYTYNVPLKSGIRDEKYKDIFSVLFQKMFTAFEPEVIVCQCGADMLSGDPLGAFNLTEKCLAKCMELVVNKNVPVLVLGGGGYNLPNTARCWTRLIAGLTSQILDENIPEHDYLERYGPDFCLSFSPSNRKDENGEEYVSLLIEELSKNIEMISQEFQDMNEIDDSLVDILDKENHWSLQNESVSKSSKPKY